MHTHGGDGLMATVIREKKPRKSCPVCGTLIDELGLANAGLTKEQLQILKRHRDNGTLGHLIHLVDIFASKMNADKALQESDQKQAMAKLENMILHVEGGLTEIIERVAGTGVGDIGERITIKDLKSLCPTDDFSAEKATKHGTDIVATVKENDRGFGTVAISVKYVAQWEGTHLQQLRKNMKQEHTSFGLLVTKAFPRDALNDKGYVKTTKSGEMLLLVKPEYAPVAYYGYRQAVMAWERAKAIIEDEKKLFREQNRITKAIMGWIAGKGFRDATTSIDEAVEYSNQTTRSLEALKSHVAKKIGNMQQDQEDLRYHLQIANTAMKDLKDLLDDKKDEGQ